MRIVVLGATGHVGTYLVPRLVRAGHEVVAASRGTRDPYHVDEAWTAAERVVLDREATDADRSTADALLELQPDIVVDMVCFTAESARQLVDGLRDRVELLVHCGTIWTHGLSTSLPIREDDPKFPFGSYGVQKHAIERLLLAETADGGLSSTVIHPGHISGPGWRVVNPVGNVEPQVWATIAAGEELVIPEDGGQLMHHVHAEDVAQLFELAVEHSDLAAGESFHAVSERALTVRGFAEGAYGWYGHEPRLRSVSWDDFRAAYGESAGASWEHLHRSQVCSIEKGRRLLGYEPAYSSLDAAREAVTWLAENDPDHTFLPPTSQ